MAPHIGFECSDGGELLRADRSCWYAAAPLLDRRQALQVGLSETESTSSVIQVLAH